MNVAMPKLEHAGRVREENTKSVKNLDIVQMAAAEKILVCSTKTTRNIALRAELELPTFKTEIWGYSDDGIA